MSLLNPKAENRIMLLRIDIVSFGFLGYRGDIRIEPQALVILLTWMSPLEVSGQWGLVWETL